MKIEKIGFIGLGLIGGSIAKAIKKNYPHIHIIGTASGENTVLEAYKEGVIDNSTLLLVSDFKDCDIIFLCGPVKINNTYLKELSGIVSHDCIITDVGSVKGEISDLAGELELEDCFIGGHPMTGSELTGFSNSAPLLLENAFYILTPSEGIPSEKIDFFRKFISDLKALPIVVDPKEHDFAAAMVSHLPHIIASSLVNLLSENDTKDEFMKTIAAGGFRDITRIASSSPVMWQNICLSNKDAILDSISLFEKEIENIKSEISSGSKDSIIEFFSDAKEYRDSLPIKKSGMGVSFEFFSDIEDKVGGIADVSRLLADNGISLKNIGIINNREFEQGVLRMEFYDEDALQRAKNVLEQNGYNLYMKK